MITVVNVIGINDENKILVKANGGSIDKLELAMLGNNTFLQKMKHSELKVFALYLGGEVVKISFAPPKEALFFNSISIAEGNRKSLQQLTQIVNQAVAPVINHPENVLLTARDKIVPLLSGIKGVVAPRCFKLAPVSIDSVAGFIAREKIDFPFLFRPVVEHGRQTLIKIDSQDDMEKLHRFAFDGVTEYYITDFFDFQSEDGLYRKMRFLVIGDEVMPRHLIISDSWQIHTENKNSQEHIKQQKIVQERYFLKKIDLSIGERCLQIKDTLGLDYIGIDCTIDREGNLVIFEANPHSMVGLGQNEIYHQAIIQSTYDALYRLIEQRAVST